MQTGRPVGRLPAGETSLDTPIDYESLAAAGSMMGSGGMVVVDAPPAWSTSARFFLGFTRPSSAASARPAA